MVFTAKSDSELARRARLYWHIDGLPTILGAVLYLLVVGTVLGLAFLFDHVDYEKAKPSFLVDLFKIVAGFAVITFPFWAIAALIWLSVNWEDIVEWFKVRLTYPRTGYVAPPRLWQTDPDQSPEKIGPTHGSKLCRVLDFLGGFWFWLLLEAVVFPLGEWQPRTSVLFVTLLVIRGLRFGIYPDGKVAGKGPWEGSLLKISEFISTVWYSFWVWVLLWKLVPSMPPHLLRWVTFVWVLSGGYWAYRGNPTADSLRRIKVIVVCVCASFCILFFSGEKVALALLVPGLCAAVVGGFRLISYLRANPLPHS